jgi:hypothetical protein
MSRRVQLVMVGSLLAMASSSLAQAAPEPKRIFLWYADGGPPPAGGDPCGRRTPPAYTCEFGSSTRDCAQRVQAFLDDWYADFNVTFTYEKPARGPFYTVVISSAGGDWCKPDFPPGVAGIAPIRDDCRDMRSGVAYAFSCGKDAKACATVIAQEQAHLVGLQHTQSFADVMCPIAVKDVQGFEDHELPLAENHMPPPCPATQNSYRLMLQRFGRRRSAHRPAAPSPTPVHERARPERGS